jgi:fructoselysine-6-P-deglycase FrlB-like protein
MSTSSVPSWHTDAFPELRTGRPWVMQEMIEAEPDLARRMGGLSVRVGEIARRVTDAARAHEPIVVTGCGTSEHGAMAVALLIQHGLRAIDLEASVVETRPGLQQAISPRVGGVCLGVSHDGTTRATMAALEEARVTGAWTAVITAAPNSPAALIPDAVLVTPMTDRSWCHTVAYLSAIMAGEAIRAAITGTAVEAAALGDYAARCLALHGDYEVVASRLKDVRTLVACGSGTDFVSARELALKLEEAVRVPAHGYELETLLHGYLVAHDSRDGAILIVTDLDAGERVVSRVPAVARVLGRIGLKVAGILSQTAASALPDDLTPAGRIVLPTSDALPSTAASLVGTAIALQSLTLALVHEAGVNPDLIRREDATYREASALAEGKHRP